MTKIFNALDWYWFVGDDQTRAYSSLLGDYVLSSDPIFVDWIADATLPTKIDTEANLGLVLSTHYPDVIRPIPTAILESYQQSQADELFKLKLIRYLFNLENRVRVLEGRPPLTSPQFRAAIKALM